MSSFNMNDELIFKAKYLKYKNKYLNLKLEQEGGVIFDKNTSIIFYESANLPKMKELKDRFRSAEESTTDTFKYKDGEKDKEVKIETFLNTPVNIPLSEVNGLVNLFEYKLGSKEINPKLILNLKLQNQLLSDIDKSKIVNLKEIGFEGDYAKLSKTIKEDVTKYNKINIALGDDYKNVNPVTTDNLKNKAEILKIKINTPSLDRVKTFNDIKKTFIDHFSEVFNEKLLPMSIKKGYTVSGDQIVFDNIDSYVVVKKFSASDDKGLTFTIISAGSDGGSSGPSQEQQESSGDNTNEGN